MKPIPSLTFRDFSDVYCGRQVNTYEELKETLMNQRAKFEPIGFLLLECQMFDSSYLGNLTILPYGPNNTFKVIPDYPLSPRGRASDMSIVIATMPAEALDEPNYGGGVALQMQHTRESDEEVHMTGPFERKLAAEAYAQWVADERQKNVTLTFPGQPGCWRFKPHKKSKQ